MKRAIEAVSRPDHVQERLLLKACEGTLLRDFELQVCHHLPQKSYLLTA
jgi:hypothetical protein